MSKDNRSKVAVVIVTYNSEKYIEKCLDSLIGAVGKETEILAVDNASSDRTPNLIEKYGERVKLLVCPANLGYAAGNNLGIRSCSRPYVFLLNPDTEVAPNFLTPLVEALEADKDVCAVQPLVRLYRERERINLSGKSLHYLGFEWCRDYYRSVFAGIPSPGELDAFSGCAVLIRRQALEEVGLFDENYFMYGEDSDLSLRFRLAGGKIVFVPESVVYHDYHFLVEKEHLPLKEKFFLVERNRLLNILTGYRLKSLLVLLPILFLTELGVLLYSLTRGLLPSKWRGYLFLWQHPNLLLRRRRHLAAIRKVGDAVLLKDAEATVSFHGFRGAGVRFFNRLWQTYWVLAKRLI